ncbi:hypothetical protein GGR51DRAFT_26104 [Nemania sp. FL0031]|nr:hypothetical protein GGR51DRAFT_26104 [Nemania sp. FL0031]
MASRQHFIPISQSTLPPVSDGSFEPPFRWYSNSPPFENGFVNIALPQHGSHRLSPMNSSFKPILSSSASKTSSKTITATLGAIDNFNWWWWWEIGSLVLALASLATLLGILAGYNGVALTNWTFFLQPNAAISILTTTIKTAIMLSISMCFSQLKWHHFSSTPRRLDDLQIIDDASRGPWGSLIILLRMRSRSFLVIGLSIATLVALTIEPTTQQLLTFPSRDTELKGVKAEIGVAYNFDAKTYQELNSKTYGRKVGLRSIVINSATGNVSPFFFSCPNPAVRCSYPSFRTLGVCFSFRNTTDISKQTCMRSNTTGSTNCSISWPTIWEDLPKQSPINMNLNYRPTDEELLDDVFQFAYLAADDAWVYMKGARLPENRPRTRTAPRFEVFECLWYWCAQTYNSSIGSAAAVSPEMMNHEALKPAGFDSKSRSNDTIYRDNSTTNVYRLGNALEFLFNEIYGALPSILYSSSNSSASKYGLTLPTDDISWFLYYSADLPMVFQNIATVLSNMVRKPNTGENLNATVIKGKALGTETYIRVRWQWALLPMIETILAVILLAATIVVTRRSRRPLLKSSVNGLLFHGLDDWTAADTARNLDGDETAEKLEALARRFKVSFRENEADGLRFVRC